MLSSWAKALLLRDHWAKSTCPLFCFLQSTWKLEFTCSSNTQQGSWSVTFSSKSSVLLSCSGPAPTTLHFTVTSCYCPSINSKFPCVFNICSEFLPPDNWGSSLRTWPPLHFSNDRYSYIRVRQWVSIPTMAISKPCFLQLLVNMQSSLKTHSFQLSRHSSSFFVVLLYQPSLTVQICWCLPHTLSLHCKPCLHSLSYQHGQPFWDHSTYFHELIFMWSVYEQMKFMNFTSWPHLGHVHDP